MMDAFCVPTNTLFLFYRHSSQNKWLMRTVSIQLYFCLLFIAWVEECGDSLKGPTYSHMMYSYTEHWGILFWVFKKKNQWSVCDLIVRKYDYCVL